MTTSANNNLYFVNPEDSAELARLSALDRFTTKAMGGTLMGIDHPHLLKQVVDIACGPGGWVLDVAHAYPKIEVAGIDISQTMIAYANARARSQGLNNASFEVIDATQPLDFSANSFDMVNGRFWIGFMTKTAWPQVVKECHRILRPGGVLRLTETDGFGPTTSVAFERVIALSAELYAHLPGDRSFAPEAKTYGITPMLPWLLQEAGFRNIKYIPHVVDFSAGTDAWSDIYQNTEVALRLIRDSIIRMDIMTAEMFDALFQQMQVEARTDRFRGLWYFLTVQGEK
jgi:ubiquinone/menaquinone biosynthesis C-methylase UbiE